MRALCFQSTKAKRDSHENVEVFSIFKESLFAEREVYLSMKNAKIIISMLLVLALVFSFAACGKKQRQQEKHSRSEHNLSDS